MALLSKISHVLTADITKDFKLKKKDVEVSEEQTFVDQLKKRRSIYDLGKRVHFSQAYIAELIQESVRSCPSAYNSQSTRIVVLFGESHQQFWDIVREVERRNVPISVFEGVEMKIAKCAKGMAQFAVWTALADLGIGASLQHYNPMIDQAVNQHFDIHSDWLMRAQLVFGSIEGSIPEKEDREDHESFRIYA
ncbi:MULTISPECIES: nitroreductase family protein [Acinetobacter]|uniref:hypothetical protein n=1 Tax=Acinetobacter TaxID=469 RepID=UPI000EA17927|nr:MULTISPECIES: hypothetical protein [Acinetobacter]RKG45735.1 hypothetical protein D7V51_03560 [Acinetobacter cumulans]RZG61041.1 hypothetical protein EXE29_04305 [Acinetobacter sp. WCHAc060006]